MIRKLSVTVLLVLLASLLTPTTVRAEKSYYAERFDVQIDLQEGGSAIITETVEFHFSGDPFSFAFREISGTETDGITFLDATMDGVAMPQGTEAGQVEVELGNPLKVTWHFPPTSNAARVFTVRYRADGIIRKDDADTFIWRAIPDDHDYSINTSTIVLNYPPQLSTLAQPSLTWDHDVTFDNGRVVLTANGIGEDQDLILMARFPLGSLAQAAPRWQTEAENRRAATARAFPVGLITGFATLVLGSLALFSYARSNAREMNVDAVASVTTNPPSDIAPAIAGKLTGQQHNFMGTIFDLAGRGVLEMQEEKGFWGSKNHMLILK